MFNSTHTFVGLAISKLGTEKWTRHATATAVIASNLPDLDSVAGLWGTAAYLDHHRGITHAIVGVPVLALVLSGIMYFFSGNFWRTFAVALIAMATHPVLDYLNPYGLRPFLPWSNKWYYGDAVFIFDPYLDAILVLGLVGAWLRPNRKRMLTLFSLAVAIAYVGFRFDLHAKAVARAETYAAVTGNAEKWGVVPKMMDPFVWDLIATSQTHVTKMNICATPCEKIVTQTIPVENPSSDAVMKASMAPSTLAFLRFARFPVTRVKQTPSGYNVMFIDFRFYNESTNTALAAEVSLDNSLRVTSDNLSFVHKLN